MGPDRSSPRRPPPASRRTPRLRTERLDLVPLRPGDAAEMAGVLADPALYAFIGGQPPSVEALRERYVRLVAGRSADGQEAWHNWIVRLAGDGQAVGTVQATVSTSHPTAEIAWMVGVPWQAHGYATEAARALVGWLERAGIMTVFALVDPRNEASAVVASRAGLLPTDELRDGERVWRRTVSAS